MTINQRALYVIDMGAKVLDNPFHSGRILTCSPSLSDMAAIVTNQPLPDGIVFSPARQRLFWSNMGTMGKNDGSIMSCDLKGGDIKVLVPPGEVHTPKQLDIDDSNGKLYFADREGLRIMRCNMDGTSLETFIEAGNLQDLEEQRDATRWCVGITVSSKLNSIFWTQKGPSRGSAGRLFCADLDSGKHAVVLLEKLSEPIDLFLDEERRTLYWTDRGELPFGNSLNELRLPESGHIGSLKAEHRILARNFNNPIGLHVDPVERQAFVADMGGSIYKCDLTNGRKEKVYDDENCAFGGITMSY